MSVTAITIRTTLVPREAALRPCIRPHPLSIPTAWIFLPEVTRLSYAEIVRAAPVFGGKRRCQAVVAKNKRTLAQLRR
jgi:hypothetical protein